MCLYLPTSPRQPLRRTFQLSWAIRARALKAREYICVSAVVGGWIASGGLIACKSWARRLELIGAGYAFSSFFPYVPLPLLLRFRSRRFGCVLGRFFGTVKAWPWQSSKVRRVRGGQRYTTHVNTLIRLKSRQPEHSCASSHRLLRVSLVCRCQDTQRGGAIFMWCSTALIPPITGHVPRYQQFWGRRRSTCYETR